MKILFIMILFFSCNNSNHYSQAIDKIDMDDLTGVWLIASLKTHDGILLKCNACPEIMFVNDGTGKIIKPSKEEIGFTYTLSSNNKIVFDFKKDQEYFEEKEFYYKVYTENQFEILELTPIDGEIGYILTR